MNLKDEVLSALLEQRGTELSGQALAGRFGVSRSAVWKAVTALRDAGWEIGGGAGSGYRLSESCDRLSAGRVSALLDNALPVAVFESIDSTNNECKRRLSQGGERFLVLSEEQTGGRGRSGKSFFSPKGSGLYMSLAMPVNAPFENAVGITAYAAVCAAGAIRRTTGRDCGIKWVNDLYLADRKVCGILTEAVAGLESGTVGSVVIGLGINLHPFPLPPELEGIVGFLDCGAVKNELAAGIARGLLAYDANDRSFMDRYRALSVVLGREVSYTLDGEARHGRAEAIADDGALLVRSGEKLDTLRGGEVSVIVEK